MASKFELNRKAVGKFLKSDEVTRAVREVVDPIRDRAEDNARAVTPAGAPAPEVEIKHYLGHDRVRFHVSMVNPSAMRAERDHRALTRAKPDAT